ncbi:hypothetical protein AG1IA_06351 [Rhizoctonia solani AG-1 IA]|uniref:Uncharacterized protein n=1 Tax=Thanatephorus cucumeris (strain AG1-IA) TaxID=983506 RepID=L8WN72_THACA|nr:hypothetical protein AG1IA_06351 [Rhizoctonia solani AG-1 IA]
MWWCPRSLVSDLFGLTGLLIGWTLVHIGGRYWIQTVSWLEYLSSKYLGLRHGVGFENSLELLFATDWDRVCIALVLCAQYIAYMSLDSASLDLPSVFNKAGTSEEP